MNSRKSQSGSAHLIIIIVLLLALIGALGFVFWQNSMQPRIDNNQIGSNSDTIKQETDLMSRNELETIVTNELSLLNGKTSIDQITNQEKLQLAVSLYAKYHPYPEGIYSRTIPASEIEAVLNNTSISTDDLVHESIKCTTATSPVHNEYEYDASAKTYSNANHGGHGIENRVYAVYSKPSDFNNSDGQYSISYKYVFGLIREFGGGDVSVYGTYLNAKNNTGSIYTFKANNDDFESSVSNDDQVKYIENNYSSFADKLSTYTYNFKKTNGKIKLVGFSVK